MEISEPPATLLLPPRPEQALLSLGFDRWCVWGGGWDSHTRAAYAGGGVEETGGGWGEGGGFIPGQASDSWSSAVIAPSRGNECLLIEGA